MMVEALSSDQVRNYALGGIVGIVVIGFLIGLVISAIVGRVVVAVVVVVLGALLWTQRTSIENKVKECKSNVSFLGVHVNLTADQQKACQTVTKH